MEDLGVSAMLGVPLPNFWLRKKVFLTGHTGFKGSWLSLWLQAMGAEICGFALAPDTAPSLFNLAGVSKEMASITGDVRDFSALSMALERFRPDVVIHMAAQPLVRHSYQHPVQTYSTNVMGTVHLLEALRKVDTVRVVVNVTTDKCYENFERSLAYSEGDPLGGHDPYSSSKACSEIVSAAYLRSYYEGAGVGLATARAGNVIGGGDWSPDRLVPDVLRSLEVGQVVTVRNPASVRPWQHVLEPLSGYLVLAQSMWDNPSGFSSGWNFGPKLEDATPVSKVVEALCSLWGDAAAWEQDARVTQLHEANYLRLDIAKAQDRLMWRPRWCLDEALSKTIEWHRSWLAGADVRDTTLNQIEAYEDILQG